MVCAARQDIMELVANRRPPCVHQRCDAWGGITLPFSITLCNGHLLCIFLFAVLFLVRRVLVRLLVGDVVRRQGDNCSVLKNEFCSCLLLLICSSSRRLTAGSHDRRSLQRFPETYYYASPTLRSEAKKKYYFSLWRSCSNIHISPHPHPHPPPKKKLKKKNRKILGAHF